MKITDEYMQELVEHFNPTDCYADKDKWIVDLERGDSFVTVISRLIKERDNAVSELAALRLSNARHLNGETMKPHNFRELVNKLRDIPAVQSKRELIVKTLKSFNIKPSDEEVVE